MCIRNCAGVVSSTWTDPGKSGTLADTNTGDEYRLTLAGWVGNLRWLGLAILVLVLDLATKSLASDALTLYRPEAITSWLNLTLAHNYGAAFSFLADAGGWQRWFFTLLASGVTLVLLVWLFRLRKDEWLTGASLGLIIGGAVGNLVDRIRLGYVVDFIDVHYAGHHWPAFNIADSAISCGIVLMLVDAFLMSRKRATGAADTEQQ
ncbi:MAG: lipoprotein signal peptidase [Xanthomonadales bacterium]|nr:lipoprotein signal peptidase [Xanthomonadales bacterium]